MVLRLTVLAAIVTVLAGAPLLLVMTALVLVLLMLAIAGRTRASTSSTRTARTERCPEYGPYPCTGRASPDVERLARGPGLPSHRRLATIAGWSCPRRATPIWGETSRVREHRCHCLP